MFEEAFKSMTSTHKSYVTSIHITTRSSLIYSVLKRWSLSYSQLLVRIHVSPQLRRGLSPLLRSFRSTPLRGSPSSVLFAPDPGRARSLCSWRTRTPSCGCPGSGGLKIMLPAPGSMLNVGSTPTLDPSLELTFKLVQAVRESPQIPLNVSAA